MPTKREIIVRTLIVCFCVTSIYIIYEWRKTSQNKEQSALEDSPDENKPVLKSILKTPKKNNLFPKTWEVESLMEDDFQSFAPTKRKWDVARAQDSQNRSQVIMDGDPRRKKMKYQGIHHFVNPPVIDEQIFKTEVTWGDSEFRYM